jgi:hypothetical protein
MRSFVSTQSTISLNRRDTSMPSVMYAITFLMISRLRFTSFSTVTSRSSCRTAFTAR